jgi:phytoene dehydrogenase-like protein
VIIGAGHNGLVAGNLLADAGWRVLVLERNDVPGGAVRSAELFGPGFTSDLFSAFYPLAAASPVLRGLALEDHGLRWCHAPAVLAHLFPDGRAAILSRDITETASSLDAFAPGDGQRWQDMVRRWARLEDQILGSFLGPFPPIRAGLALLRRLGLGDSVRLARLGALSVRRLGDEQFRGDGARLLLEGSALHSDVSPHDAGSALFGWLLTMVGQRYGFPVPRGGADQLTAALVRRFTSAGGEIRCGEAVERIVVGQHRARGVRTVMGELIAATRAVLADVDAPTLFHRLVGAKHLPQRFLDDLRSFSWDYATLKVDWVTSAPIPWSNPDAARAGTVHFGVDRDGLSDYANDLSTGRRPAHPFIVLGQMSAADPTRSPHGTQMVWAYTHVPQSLCEDRGAVERQVDVVEKTVEQHAPGFRDVVMSRAVQSPPSLQAGDANLANGAINGGTAKPYQELIFRPMAGLGRAETPVAGLFLAGSSAHPGGGVHGGPGANAARAALLHASHGPRRLGAAVARGAQRAMYSGSDRSVIPPAVVP